MTMADRNGRYGFWKWNVTGSETLDGWDGFSVSCLDVEFNNNRR